MLVQTPVSVGAMTLNTRLVLPPMATYGASESGAVTERLLEHYRSRAAGGRLGLIITEHSCICRQGKAGRGQISLGPDADPAGLAALTAAIHVDGVRAMAQLNHAGSAADPAVTGQEIVSASAVANPGRKPGTEPAPLPRALTAAEIRALEQQFADAALRAKAAGYDAVEIHAAHGYLLNQFFSPLTNRRRDEYGAHTVENRLRFTLETVAAVRRAVGPDYPVAVRLGGCDYLPGGSTLEDAAEACRLLTAAGVDLLDVSGGMCRYTRPGHGEPGWFSDLSAAAKAASPLPVLLTGGVTAAAEAEALLQAGKADLIGVGRAVLQDPRWAEKQW